ncbi:MAG: tRNA pseudouridine(13) synthase TruD, partial [Candidatus Heimdallarchaeota archaeon]|nr:tRNA pseudouridine(13) synthase TruD [Candidatus Heimdallarchaeota archaeon]MCK4770480.1 tRNA pseudouridine(13) synthase TruD [Candidatus Heimdallarchaeota archaeon]
IGLILKEIKDIGGIQNSFGIQRFGEIRPITHLVGKKLLEGNLKEALKIYIGKVFDRETENVEKARKSFWENEDVEQALDLFPSHLRIERKLLLSLKKRKQSYIQALTSLPLQLQKLFIHAFQSFLFNRYLKTRQDLYGKKITDPISGEVVKNNAVFIPLIGAKTKLEGEMGEIYQSILEEEELSLLEFQKPFIKKIGGKGAFRSISFNPEEIRITESGKDDLNEGRTKVKMSFKIKKGSYATEFLREIMS